jgi:hypothetical protein
MQETLTSMARNRMNFLQPVTVTRQSAIQLLSDKAGGFGVMSFGLYLLGFVLLIIGVSYGAHMAHVPTQWIVVTIIALLGIGIMTGVSRTRTRDPQ